MVVAGLTLHIVARPEAGILFSHKQSLVAAAAMLCRPTQPFVACMRA